MRLTILPKLLSPVIFGLMHGVFITMIVLLFLNSSFEDKLYEQIIDKVTTDDLGDEESVLALLHITHKLLKPRLAIFGGQEYINIRDTVFRGADLQLIDSKGACGSYTHVLGKLLQRAGSKIRIAQMKCGETWGCHILLETRINGKWVVLDAMYDLAFRTPKGELASFKEVSENWTYFRNQVPSDYALEYAYENVRYTNWDKIPILMPTVKAIMDTIIGKKAETISVRSYMLDVYKVYGIIFLIVYCFFIVFTVFALRNNR